MGSPEVKMDLAEFSDLVRSGSGKQVDVLSKLVDIPDQEKRREATELFARLHGLKSPDIISEENKLAKKKIELDTKKLNLEEEEITNKQNEINEARVKRELQAKIRGMNLSNYRSILGKSSLAENFFKIALQENGDSSGESFRSLADKHGLTQELNAKLDSIRKSITDASELDEFEMVLKENGLLGEHQDKIENQAEVLAKKDAREKIAGITQAVVEDVKKFVEAKLAGEKTDSKYFDSDGLINFIAIDNEISDALDESPFKIGLVATFSTEINKEISNVLKSMPDITKARQDIEEAIEKKNEDNRRVVKDLFKTVLKKATIGALGAGASLLAIQGLGFGVAELSQFLVNNTQMTKGIPTLGSMIGGASSAVFGTAPVGSLFLASGSVGLMGQGILPKMGSLYRKGKSAYERNSRGGDKKLVEAVNEAKMKLKSVKNDFTLKIAGMSNRINRNLKAALRN